MKNLINNDNEPPQPQQPEYIDTTNNNLVTLNGTNRAKVTDVSSIIVQTARSTSPPAGCVVVSYWGIQTSSMIGCRAFKAYVSESPNNDTLPVGAYVIQVILPDASVGILDLSGFAVNADGNVTIPEGVFPPYSIFRLLAAA